MKTWNELGPDERDLLVATEVLGWHFNGLYWTWGIEKVTETAKLPGLSTEIQYAWLVVERMREKGWRLELLALSTNPLYVAKFVNLATDNEFIAVASTAPEAICLAACRAEGVGV